MRTKEQVNKHIGNQIQKLRKSRGFTQKEVSEYLSLTRPSFANIERGVHSISIDKLINFCELMEVEMNYFSFSNERNGVFVSAFKKPMSIHYELDKMPLVFLMHVNSLYKSIKELKGF